MLSALAPYRRVLTVPGAWQFSLAGFVARLPLSMVSLGIVLLISLETGSYGLAGTVASAYLVANALVAIAHGRLADRFGQHRVLPVVQVGYTVALALMVHGVLTGWPAWPVHVLAAVAGAAMPQIGSCVRARWSYVLDDNREVQTAYALESVVDEALFVTGPTVVTVLATGVHPTAGLLTAMACGLVGTLALSSRRETEPPASRRRNAPDGTSFAMPWRTVLPMAAVCLALGAVFGSLEVATVAFADERGGRAWAGPLLGVLAVGSLLAGLVSGAVHWRTGPEVRVRWGVLALGVLMAPLVLLDSLWLMGLCLLLGGLAVAPTLIAALAVTEQAVPSTRITEGMSILHTGMGIGIAPGSSVAGMLVDAHGAAYGFLVPAVACLGGAVAAFAAHPPARAARPGRQTVP